MLVFLHTNRVINIRRMLFYNLPAWQDKVFVISMEAFHFSLWAFSGVPSTCLVILTNHTCKCAYTSVFQPLWCSDTFRKCLFLMEPYALIQVCILLQLHRIVVANFVTRKFGMFRRNLRQPLAEPWGSAEPQWKTLAYTALTFLLLFFCYVTAQLIVCFA